MKDDLVLEEDISNKTGITKCGYFRHEQISETQVRIFVQFIDDTPDYDEVIELANFTREKIRDSVNLYYVDYNQG